MAVNTPTIKGITTIVWGTLGQLGSPSGSIVESVAITPKNGAPIQDIENGDGASVANVLLSDGFDAKATVVYDTAKTYPALGSAVTLTIPTGSGSGGTTAYSCFVCGDPDINTARKQEAKITLPLRYRPGITP